MEAVLKIALIFCPGKKLALIFAGISLDAMAQKIGIAWAEK